MNRLIRFDQEFSCGLMLQSRVTLEAPAQAELRPPMVCVKLPRSVLVVFHLFRATKLPLYWIEVQQMNHFESRFLLAPHCPLCGWTRQPPIGACQFRQRMMQYTHRVQEERARPTYQRVLHPRANTGVRRSKVEGVLKSFSFSASSSS